MIITISAVAVSWVLIVAASFCTFMIGRATMSNKEEVVEATIVYLVENNFVRSKRVDGEIEIVPLDYNEDNS